MQELVSSLMISKRTGSKLSEETELWNMRKAE